jgi:hypothetical protein
MVKSSPPSLPNDESNSNEDITSLPPSLPNDEDITSLPPSLNDDVITSLPPSMMMSSPPSLDQAAEGQCRGRHCRAPKCRPGVTSAHRWRPSGTASATLQRASHRVIFLTSRRARRHVSPLKYFIRPRHRVRHCACSRRR